MSATDKGVASRSKSAFNSAFNRTKVAALAQSRAAEISSLRQSLVQACTIFGVSAAIHYAPLRKLTSVQVSANIRIEDTAKDIKQMCHAIKLHLDDASKRVDQVGVNIARVGADVDKVGEIAGKVSEKMDKVGEGMDRIISRQDRGKVAISLLRY
jgi:methyl-accepting chemotaxis protein